MRTLFLVAVLALTAGCGTVRALAGPDPGFAAAAPGIGAALDRDSIAHPEFKAQNDAAKALLESVTKPGLPPPPPNPANPTDWLLWGFATLIGTFTGGKTVNRIIKKRKEKKAKAPEKPTA